MDQEHVVALRSTPKIRNSVQIARLLCPPKKQTKIIPIKTEIYDLLGNQLTEGDFVFIDNETLQLLWNDYLNTWVLVGQQGEQFYIEDQSFVKKG